MMRSIVALTLSLALSSQAHAFDVATLMTELASQQGGRASFVEKKYIAVLDAPVVSSGEMVFTPPDRLEKRTILPKPETMLLDKDTLSLERDQRKLTIRLDSMVEVRAFIESIRGTLSGDRTMLEKSYLLDLSGTRDDWRLTLLPSDLEIARQVHRITITGRGGRIQGIEYLLADGDRTELSIRPIGKR